MWQSGHSKASEVQLFRRAKSLTNKYLLLSASESTTSPPWGAPMAAMVNLIIPWLVSTALNLGTFWSLVLDAPFHAVANPLPWRDCFVIFCGFTSWNLLTDKKMAWDWKITRDKTVGDTRYTSVDEQKQLPMFVYVFSVPQVPHQPIQRIWLKCNDRGFFGWGKNQHTQTLIVFRL